jgi:hypothetical protein
MVESFLSRTILSVGCHLNNRLDQWICLELISFLNTFRPVNCQLLDDRLDEWIGFRFEFHKVGSAVAAR